MFGGGIVPEADLPELTKMGVAKVFTPGATTGEIVDWVAGQPAGRPRAVPRLTTRRPQLPQTPPPSTGSRSTPGSSGDVRTVTGCTTLLLRYAASVAATTTESRWPAS